MRYNRLLYDKCAYKETLAINDNSLGYNMDVLKYENPLKCRPELGILGGTQVSHIRGNITDLENQLRGQGSISHKNLFLGTPLQHLRSGQFINLGPEK